MCGVLGLVSHEPVNQMLYDGLQMLQHRGQDAAGIVTAEGNIFHMHKGKGMVREVFRTRNMRDLVGNAGIAHVRYPTAGNAGSSAEAQPFYVSSPFGIVLAHNGNLTNTEELYENVCNKHLRHVNTSSDSEVLLNVFAHELRREVSKNTVPYQLTIDNIFNAVSEVHRLVRGAYGVVAMIAGYGMLAFRDPFGIRPLVLGSQIDESGKNLMPLLPNPLPSMHLPMIWNAISIRAKPYLLVLTARLFPVNAAIKLNSALVFSNMFILPARTPSSMAFPFISPVWIWAYLWQKNQTRAACR